MRYTIQIIYFVSKLILFTPRNSEFNKICIGAGNFYLLVRLKGTVNLEVLQSDSSIIISFYLS